MIGLDRKAPFDGRSIAVARQVKPPLDQSCSRTLRQPTTAATRQCHQPPPFSNAIHFQGLAGIGRHTEPSSCQAGREAYFLRKCFEISKCSRKCRGTLNHYSRLESFSDSTGRSDSCCETFLKRMIPAWLTLARDCLSLDQNLPSLETEPRKRISIQRSSPSPDSCADSRLSHDRRRPLPSEFRKG